MAEERETQLAAELKQREAVLASRPKSASAAQGFVVTPPDPNHQGGWPANADYFYLPKNQLTNAGFRLVAGGHLTEETARLFGMSAAERSAVDTALRDMTSQFRTAEASKMKTVDAPPEWGGPGFNFDSALVYQIPSLAAEADSARQALASQLDQTLGAGRSQALQQIADSYLRDQLDDLGSGDRTVAFLWELERDGSHSLWYGLSDARHGAGSFQRVPDKVDPDSQIAYYAALFGVQLP